jgi:hypothetical protein
MKRTAGTSYSHGPRTASSTALAGGPEASPFPVRRLLAFGDVAAEGYEAAFAGIDINRISLHIKDASILSQVTGFESLDRLSFYPLHTGLGWSPRPLSLSVSLIFQV